MVAAVRQSEVTALEKVLLLMSFRKSVKLSKDDKRDVWREELLFWWRQHLNLQSPTLNSVIYNQKWNIRVVVRSWKWVERYMAAPSLQQQLAATVLQLVIVECVTPQSFDINVTFYSQFFFNKLNHGEKEHKGFTVYNPPPPNSPCCC